MEEDISKDINPVSHPSLNNSVTCDSFGEMEEKGLIQRVGIRILNVEKWWGGKLFEITIGHLVLVVGILALIAGFLCGLKTEQSRNDSFFLNKDKYMMVGVSQVPGYKNIFIPVYKTETSIIRGE